jgi:hypothetical protein
MPVVTRHQALQAMERGKITHMNNLPAEIIEIIAGFLYKTPSTEPFNPEHCACVVGHDARRMTANTREAFAKDPRLALSCVSRRMRAILFEQQLNRSISTIFCEGTMSIYEGASIGFRDSVR